MRARNIILIAFALIAALGTAYFVKNWTASQRPVVIEQVQAAAMAPAAEILVASRTLAAGSLLRPDDLEWLPWPEDGVSPAYVVRGPADASVPDPMARFEGAVVRHGITAGEPVTENRVVRPDDRGFMAAILSPGMRAVSVPISATTGIAGFVFPGDRVDVILIHAIERGDAASDRTLRASETVLTNVRVLAVDQRVTDQGNPVVAKTATLEVTPKQAETITMLTEMGRLTLSLRSLAWEGTVLAEAAGSEPSIAEPGPKLHARQRGQRPAQPAQNQRHRADPRGQGGPRRCRRGAELREPAGMSATNLLKRSIALCAALSLALLIAVSLTGRAEAVEVIDAAEAWIEIEMHKGSLVRLPEAAVTVFIANPEIADIQVKSPTLIYVFGKRAGETTLYAVGAGENILANLGIRVSHNLGRLREVVAESGLDAEIEVASVAGTLVVTGMAHSAAAAEEVRRLAAQFVGTEDGFLMRVGVDAPNQVNLRVRIAEVSRSAIKQFGINWDAVFSSGNFLIGLATGNPVVAGAAFATRENNNNNLFGSFSTGRFDVNGLVDGLADEGLLSVLAEPNLTALSGETASFLAGGEFPIPVSQDQDTITVQFKKFGVQLSFTPVLLDNDRISLRVSPEVSQLTSGGAVEFNSFSIPALTTRRADTMVELASGQSFAIAGLLQNNLDHDVSKFPGLGDLPVIGSLFHSDTFRRDESELVIIITPYIVQPVSERTLATPVDGMVPANDLDRILSGTNSGLPDTVGLGPEGARLEGSVGFILD